MSSVLHPDAEGLGNRPQQVVGLELRADDLRRHDGAHVEFLEQRAHQRRLAGADLAGDDQEALALVHAVLQVRKGARVPLAPEVEGRIGTQLEGLAGQAIEFFVHASLRGGETARRRSAASLVLSKNAAAAALFFWNW